MNLFVFLLLFISVLSFAQTTKYILTTGTNGYVTITQYPGYPPCDYTRGYVFPSWSISPKGDTQMKLSLTNGTSTVPITSGYIVDTNYQNGDASRGNFPNADSLYRWTRRHMQKYVGN